MKTIDEMPINDAIQLYYEKQHAIQAGDINALIKIKKECPELFDPQKEAALRDIIEYAKQFQASDRYKELSRDLVKEKLKVIKNDSLD